MDMSNIKERLTQKIGPLPMWLWAVIIVGVGYVGYTVVRSRIPSDTSADAYDPTMLDDTNSLTGGYSTDFPNAGTSNSGSSGGLSTGSGGSQYVIPPNELLAQQNPWTPETPLPVYIQGVNSNLYTGSAYAEQQPQQQTQAPAVDPRDAQRASLQAQLDQALAQSVSNNAARKSARDAYNNAPANKKAGLLAGKLAAEQASERSDALVGTLRAQLATL